MKPSAPAIVRCLRIVVSVLFLTVITLSLIEIPAWLIIPSGWMTSLQLGNAMMGLSVGILVAWTIITLIFGRIYCSSVCPLGTLQDIIARLRPKRIYRYRAPRPGVAIFLMVLLVAADISGLGLLFSLLDPYSQFRHFIEAIIDPRWLLCIVAAVNFVIVAVMAWMGGRLYCTMVCPMGGALSLISRTSFFHIEIDPDKCTRCRKCSDVCKSSCINVDTSVVDFSQCVACFNCLTACHDDAIHYTPDRKQLSTPMFQRIEKNRAQTAPTCMQCESTSSEKQTTSAK